MKKIVVLITILSAIACKKNIVKINEDYVGTWIGQEAVPGLASGYGYHIKYSVTIMPSGRGNYQKDGLLFDNTKEGFVKIRKDKIRVGLKTFTVQQHPTYIPHEDGYYYTMQLDSITYFRFE